MIAVQVAVLGTRAYLADCFPLKGILVESPRQGTTASATQRKTFVSICKSALQRQDGACTVSRDAHKLRQRSDC